MTRFISRIYISISLSVLLALASGCSRELLKSVTDLVPLRSALTKEYKLTNVTLSIQNGTVFSVAVINSELNSVSRAERQVKAKQIAGFVNKHYGSIGKIERIAVVFVVHKNYFVYQYNAVIDGYTFEKASL